MSLIYFKNKSCHFRFYKQGLCVKYCVLGILSFGSGDKVLPDTHCLLIYISQLILGTCLNTNVKTFEGFYVLLSLGIDIDGRIAEMEKGLSYYEKKVQLFVTFGKAIPGFKQLPLDDQASLVKGNVTKSLLTNQ